MVYFINNNFIDQERATLHVSDLSIQRGFALFDFLRTSNNIPLFIDDYLTRFYNSCKLLGLEPLHDSKELKHVIHQLIDINKTPDSGLKIILTGGYSSDGYAQSTPNIIITQSPLAMPAHATLGGIKLITHDYIRQMPSVKSTNYLMGVWLQKQIRERGAEDVLYYHDNLITELPRSNFFIVTQADELVTPKENVLAGITRRKVLEVAKQICKVEERPVTLTEVFSAKEAFITSTTKRLQTVTHINGTIINNGKTGSLTSQLSEAFIKLENEYLQSSLPLV